MTGSLNMKYIFIILDKINKKFKMYRKINLI